MRRHYLELSSGREHKFYELTLDGPTLRVRYGRIGTDGQTQHKTYPTEDAALRDAEKKLTEKRRKGYTDAIMGEREKQKVTPPRITLPAVLKPYRARIEATLKPAISLERAEGPTSPWSSKIGGVPYRELGQPWPTTREGLTLAFLAQLNFAELPHLHDFPSEGLAQFFLLDDDQMGCDFGEGGTLDEQPQDTFRVIFHPTVTQDNSKLDPAVPEREWDCLPHDPSVEVPLRGELADDVISAQDRLFDDLVGIDFLDETETDDGESLGDARYYAYAEVTSLTSKVGGHANFTQNDPRGTEDPHVLLFQLDSEPDLGVMWGDTGIANFFIRPDDLARLDFSRVYYNWDCH
ncbi:DUF1963 domain-containing protein [Deinococcus pimensis]|uniref:DUF1963 domain-containing protein n=1 Tax=Deinococcus pimensis TaxID=309888 RepID=UPI0004B38418|nr:DUF1963 domain-containing protein [Deinococcus pimensis]